MSVLPFAKCEFQTRVKNIKARMAEQKLEVLIVSDPANLYYVSGYDALSYYVPQVVIVSLDLDEPVAIIRMQDHYCATETCWMANENIIPYPDKYLWEPMNMHVFDFVADFLKGKGLDKKRYGVELDSFFLPAYWYQRLCDQLPSASFVDSGKLVAWVRGPKSPQELEYMAIAARHTEKAMYDAVALMGDGVRECDVAAEICHSLIAGNGVYGGEFPSLPPIIPAGERTAGAHFSWTTEGKYQEGQTCYMEISGVYKRYHAPLSRTVFVGKPHQKIADTASAVVEGLNAAMGAIKPGAVSEDVERVWQTTINKLGYHKESRCGYTVGIGYPPVWCEETIFFKPSEKSVLVPNMTFHLMCGLWLEGYGVAITETLQVTDTGCQSITKFPRRLLSTDDYC